MNYNRRGDVTTMSIPYSRPVGLNQYQSWFNTFPLYNPFISLQNRDLNSVPSKDSFEYNFPPRNTISFIQKFLPCNQIYSNIIPVYSIPNQSQTIIQHMPPLKSYDVQPYEMLESNKDGNNTPRQLETPKSDGLNSPSQQSNKTSKKTTSHMKRNVYKSIIRGMMRYVNNYKDDAINILKENGYTDIEISQAFNKVKNLNSKDIIWKNPKKSHGALRSILAEKCACTFILKEAVQLMMNTWKEGNTGRLHKSNLIIYKEVCEDIYEKSLKFTKIKHKSKIGRAHV